MFPSFTLSSEVYILCSCDTAKFAGILEGTVVWGLESTGIRPPAPAPHQGCCLASPASPSLFLKVGEAGEEGSGEGII
jgi:hypothetical protein